MTRYMRISTLLRAADSLALLSGRTLKPMMMALEVVASMTSLSLMAPTAQWIDPHPDFLVGQLLQAGLDGLGGAWTSP